VRIFAAALAICAVWPATADALGVRAEDVFVGHDGMTAGVDVHVTTAPGERNDVILQRRGDRLVVTERGAPLVVGDGCTALGADAASCPLPLVLDTGVFVLLGDEADSIVVTVPPPTAVVVFGGAGDDRLSGLAGLNGEAGDDTISGARFADGGAGDDHLTGGPADDRLAGGGGADVLDGGPGDDMLVDETSPDQGPDRLEGGPGRDLLDYGLHQESVVVDLGESDAQVAGTADFVTGFEDVQLGGGDDVVHGTDGRNAIWTGPGDDVIRAGGGSDTIFAGPGRDNVDAGRDFLTDTIACGGGPDLLDAEELDVIRACDVIDLDGADRPATRLQRRGRQVRVVLRCARVTTDCRGDVELRTRGGSVLGRAAFACAADPCAAAAMRIRRRAHPVRVTVVTTFADGRGEAVQHLSLASRRSGRGRVPCRRSRTRRTR
jgi:Ca2+-binding RTX toxin-like protein